MDTLNLNLLAREKARSELVSRVEMDRGRYEAVCLFYSSLSALFMWFDHSCDINIKISRKVGLNKRNRSYGRLKMD